MLATIFVSNHTGVLYLNVLMNTPFFQGTFPVSLRSLEKSSQINTYKISVLTSFSRFFLDVVHFVFDLIYQFFRFTDINDAVF